MCPGEKVRHNQIDVKTAGMWDKLGEWTNSFGGAGLVVRLKKDLGIAEIRKALTSWNIQDRKIKRMMDKTREEVSSEEENNEMKSDAGLDVQNDNNPQEEEHREERVKKTNKRGAGGRA